MEIQRFVSSAAQAVCATGLALACACSLAQPTDKIIGSSARQVELFVQPGAAQAERKIDAAGFPWPIIETKDDFHRVRIDGRDYWVDGMNVRVQRQSGARCTTRVAQYDRTGGTPGAGENFCK